MRAFSIKTLTEEEQIKTSPKFENDDKAYRELYDSTAISLTEIK